MSMKTLDNVLIALAIAPEGEIDKKITPKFRELMGKSEEEIAEGLLALIGECGVYGYASDFAMAAINQTYSMVNAVVELRKIKKEKEDE